jgi:hypothetical protein
MVGRRATSVETVNTTVEAMRAQVQGLATAVNNLAYDTMARYCYESRTNKGTTLFLSLRDGDGFLVDIHQAKLWLMKQLASFIGLFGFSSMIHDHVHLSFSSCQNSSQAPHSLFLMPLGRLIDPSALPVQPSPLDNFHSKGKLVTFHIDQTLV